MGTTLKDLLYDSTAPAAPELAVVEDGAVRCVACGHRCLIQDGRSGICKVRFNRGGQLRVPWGYVASVQCDPIEKKPFFHAYPGRDALTFGMLGCDFHCGYCQNWVTSQALRDPQAMAPPRFCQPIDLVNLARQNRAPVMVSSYNEPLITSDWSVQVFRVARQHGIVCGYVSNGNATPEVLRFLRPHADLYKVDLKGFQDKHYRELGGVLKNVLDGIVQIKRMGFWLEVVTLVVPGWNDSDAELRGIAKFLAGVSPEIPWHVTSFHPDYKMNEAEGYSQRTPADTLLRAYDIGREAGLWFVYPGNLPGQVGDREHTYCPHCGAVAIKRHGFYVLVNTMVGNCCFSCQKPIPGVWEANPPRQSTGTGVPRPVRLPHYDRARGQSGVSVVQVNGGVIQISAGP
jgi:pyruvate formate lyase activating enzyme